MTVLQGVLAGAGLVAVLMGLMWRMFVHFDAKNESRFEQLDAKSDRLDAKNESRIDRLDAKNERAHTAITENVKAVDDRAEQRSEAQRATLESIARDVSFLAGRQAERDRQAERASGKIGRKVVVPD